MTKTAEEIKLDAIKNQVAHELNNSPVIWTLESSLIVDKLVVEVAKRHANEYASPLKKRIQELEDKIGTVIEMLKADMASAIELQEQEQDEDFNRGREEAFDYVLELLTN